jgi:type II secretory pathway component GspD/PulD (secretin)
MHKIGFFLLCCWLGTVFAQSFPTKMITLHYRTAKEVIALIEPMLEPDEKISGSGQTILLQASPKTLDKMQTILHQFDKAPDNFLISIHQGPPDWLNQADSNIITSPSPSQRQMSQSVQVLDGESAFITTSETVPIISNAGGMYSGVAFEQQESLKGFWVKPQLQGSRVRLTIKRTREQENPHSQNTQQFEGQKLTTTVMIPLNKWVKLGSGEDAMGDDPNTNTIRAGGGTFARSATLYIKVGKGARN